MIPFNAVQSTLPAKVDIVEVCPRDGLQNLQTFVPTPVKKKMIDALLEAGLRYLEATSFVSPKAVPQMADAAELARYAVEKAGPGVHVMALTPNVRGARDAWEAGIKEINYVMSVSESHNKANINRTRRQSVDELKQIADTLPDMQVTVALATAFGCPFEGEVPLAATVHWMREALLHGGTRVTLSDTIGVANPAQIISVVEGVRKEFADLPLGLHLHDTHGTGLANAFAGLLAGITRFESAAGGLGGCPFAPGAAGNTATEDMVNMFRRMGIETGIDLARLIDLTRFIRNEQISPALTTHLGSARSYEEFTFFPPPALLRG